MDPAVALAAVVAAFLAGGGLGWFAASRPLADLRARLADAEGQAAAREEEFRQAIAELGAARIEVARLTANAENFDKQIALLQQAREDLLKEFQNAGHAVLTRAQEDFLKRAEERFRQSEEKGEEKLKALLAPVGEKLTSYERQVQELETRRSDAFAALHAQIEEMRKGQEAVRAEAARLGNSLRSAPKVRGNWGEQQLRNVLEQCGLAEHTDFRVEHSIDTEEGRLRPDAIVRIPGNKQLVIDAKVSLVAYQDAFDTDDENVRAACLAAHAAALRTHVQQLGAKAYFAQFENAPDYVVMFVPGEHFISAAMEHDSGLWDYAFSRRVLIASPTNLVAIARTIAQVWQHEGLAREAREIGKLASDLYDSIAKTQEDLTKLGTHLGRAVNSFNDFARTYDGNVLRRAQRLADKHVKIGKREIAEDVPFVEALPRGEASTGAMPAPDAQGKAPV